MAHLPTICAALLSIAGVPLCAVAAPVTATDTLTASEAFVRLPVSTLDLLRTQVREDMITYFQADSVWRAPNTMEGQSYILNLNRDYINVRITPISNIEIRVLNGGSPKQCAVSVYTIGGNNHAYDSQLQFYNGALSPISAKKLIDMPELKDFISIPKSAPVTYRDIEETIPFPTVKWEADAGSDNLTATLTVESFMTREAFDKVKNYIMPSLTYVWDGKKYKLVTKNK